MKLIDLEFHDKYTTIIKIKLLNINKTFHKNKIK